MTNASFNFQRAATTIQEILYRKLLVESNRSHPHRFTHFLQSILVNFTRSPCESKFGKVSIYKHINDSSLNEIFLVHTISRSHVLRVLFLQSSLL